MTLLEELKIIEEESIIDKLSIPGFLLASGLIIIYFSRKLMNKGLINGIGKALSNRYGVPLNVAERYINIVLNKKFSDWEQGDFTDIDIYIKSALEGKRKDRYYSDFLKSSEMQQKQSEKHGTSIKLFSMIVGINDYKNINEINAHILKRIKELKH